MALHLLSSSFFGSRLSLPCATQMPLPQVPISTNKNVVVACVSVARRSTQFQPSFWNYDYIMSLKSDYTGDKYKIRALQLKANVKHLLDDESMGMVSKLDLVDAIQRLGVGYHFEEEIKSILKHTFMDTNNHWSGVDLYATALRFRLLRQHGYDVPVDVLDRFKDRIFSSCSCSSEDVKGILSLYEACHFGLESEKSMDEAKLYTTKYLKNIAGNKLSPTLAQKVAHSLELPLHWRLPRVEARWYIDIYGSEETMYPILLQFSKLDFNMVQAIHQREVSRLARWWMELGTNKLSFTKDRLVEHYLWSLGLVPEPRFWWSREVTAKINCLVTLMDDMYDNYGSLEELELFTEAVERWNVNAMEQLPHYMKICYMAVLNTNTELGFEILKEQGFDITRHQRKMWTDLCKAYMLEAKWAKMRYTPKLEEYINNAVITIGSLVSLINCYFTSEKVTKEAIRCIEGMPSLIRSASMIVRLVNDLGTSNNEIKRGDVPKSIQCYMHDAGVTEEVSREHVRHLISEAWKRINKARCAQHPFSDHFVNAALNHGRIAHCTYHYGDGHGSPEVLSNCLKSLVVEPISFE